MTNGMTTEEVEQHVKDRYEIQKRLGKGAYGIVWKAVDKRNKEIVALKKVFPSPSTTIDIDIRRISECNGFTEDIPRGDVSAGIWPTSEYHKAV